MKNKLSGDTWEGLLQKFDTHFGLITRYEFLKSNGVVANYLFYFEAGKQRVSMALDENEKISGLLFKPIEDTTVAKFERNLTSLQLPFKGDWFTFWGGDNKRQNYHVIQKAQQGAFDFIVLDKHKKSFTRSGTRNEDYYAFGKPIYAVCDAIVHTVIKDVEDNKPGAMNPKQASGNTVVLLTKNGEYIHYSHFMKASIVVDKDDQVKKGQYLGDCGNSGNSSEPHLHLHIQDSDNPFTAVGVRCYFENIKVNDSLKSEYSPVKGDVISFPKG